MRIVNLYAENFKRLTVVEIAPNGSVIQVTGRNGAGKSAVLDALYAALAGESVIDPRPIRTGQSKAKVRLDLGDIIVTRKWTEKGTTLLVEAPNGAVFRSPQTLLDSLLGALSFDPSEFARMSPSQQAEALRKLVGLDVSGFDRVIAEKYAERTDVNRRVRSLAGRLATLNTEIDPKATVELIDISALLEQMQGATEHNGRVAAELHRRADEDARAGQLRGFIERIEREIAALQAQQRAHETELDNLNIAIAGREPVADTIKVGEIRQQVEDARVVNAQCEKQAQVRQVRERVVDELTAAKLDAENLTNAIGDQQTLKQQAIAAAAFPVEGLTFDEEGRVTYNGVPFEQASSAEQLRVSVHLAMAANPKLKILRIRDGSLLDENSLRALTEMVELNGYQCWLERVETSGRVGIVMEDGAVVAIDGEPIPRPETEPEPVSTG